MADGARFFLSGIEHRKIFAKGKIAIRAGFPNQLCAHVVTGNMKMTASTHDGREQIISLLFPGDFVGQPFAHESGFTVTALTETELSIYDRADFENFLSLYPEYARGFLRQVTATLDSTRERVLSLGQCDVHARIAAFLIDLLDRAEGSSRVEIPFSRADMADYVGATIESVSRHLASLKCIGAIALIKGGRSISVLDRRLLEDALARL